MTTLAPTIPAPAFPPSMPPADADEATFAAWADAEALAMMRSEGYVGIRADRLLLRGIPSEAMDWSIATFPATTTARHAALALARDLADDPDGFARRTGRAGFMLCGRAGRGKTGLAVSLAAALLESGREFTFVRWGALADECFEALGTRRGRKTTIAPRYSADGTPLGDAVDGLSAITARLAAVDVLVIDDLGEAGASTQPDFLRRVFREVLWPRYERRAITVVTTNLPQGELEAQFGEAAVSRLAGMLRWVVLDGADERRRVAA